MKTRNRKKIPTSFKRVDKKYNNAEETKRVFVGNGHINATKHFPYLGSYTSYHLIYDMDINRRITHANQMMGGILPYFTCVHFDIFSKYLIFMTIPMNPLLWGCKYWALRELHLNQLSTFMHTAIRSITGITIIEVIEDRIRNIRVRKICFNIPGVHSQIVNRLCIFIRKVVRGPHDHPPTQLLTARCNNPQPSRCLITTNRVSIVKNL